MQNGNVFFFLRFASVFLNFENFEWDAGILVGAFRRVILNKHKFSVIVVFAPTKKTHQKWVSGQRLFEMTIESHVKINRRSKLTNRRSNRFECCAVVVVCCCSLYRDSNRKTTAKRKKNKRNKILFRKLPFGHSVKVQVWVRYRWFVAIDSGPGKWPKGKKKKKNLKTPKRDDNIGPGQTRKWCSTSGFMLISMRLSLKSNFPIGFYWHFSGNYRRRLNYDWRFSVNRNSPQSWIRVGESWDHPKLRWRPIDRGRPVNGESANARSYEAMKPNHDTANESQLSNKWPIIARAAVMQIM